MIIFTYQKVDKIRFKTMKSSAEIREMFLSFFEKEHNSARVKSSSLIPDNPTILLTTAGFVQFMPFYLGAAKHPNNPPRATSCQKRARDGGKKLGN